MEIKDSGKRQQYDSGMVRDVTDDKIDYTLITDGPMFERWAVHMTKGARKYAERNWMKARGDGERQHFRQSAFRHFMKWFRGEVDEDHAAAVFFNINGVAYMDELAKESPLLTEAVLDVEAARRRQAHDARIHEIAQRLQENGEWLRQELMAIAAGTEEKLIDIERSLREQIGQIELARARQRSEAPRDDKESREQ